MEEGDFSMAYKINLSYHLKRPTLLFIILTIIIVPILKLLNIFTTDTLIIMMSFIGYAAALNIIMGFTGYVDFGHTVFIGISGYTYVLLIWYLEPFNILQHFGSGIGALILAILAGLVSAVVAVLVGYPVLKLRGAYFAIATLGLDFAALYIVKSTVPALNPSQFMAAEIVLRRDLIVPKSMIFNAVLVAVSLTLLANYIISKSRFGIGLVAIREDEDAAEDIGVPTTKYKIIAYSLSAFFTGLIGSLMILNSGGVNEGAFHISHSIDMIVMLVIGGLGSVFGSILGGYIYYWLYDTLLVKFPGINLIILGIIVIIIVLFAPEGITGIISKYKIKNIKLRDLID